MDTNVTKGNKRYKLAINVTKNEKFRDALRYIICYKHATYVTNQQKQM